MRPRGALGPRPPVTRPRRSQREAAERLFKKRSAGSGGRQLCGSLRACKHSGPSAPHGAARPDGRGPPSTFPLRAAPRGGRRTEQLLRRPSGAAARGRGRSLNRRCRGERSGAGGPRGAHKGAGPTLGARGSARSAPGKEAGRRGPERLRARPAPGRVAPLPTTTPARRPLTKARDGAGRPPPPPPAQPGADSFSLAFWLRAPPPPPFHPPPPGGRARPVRGARRPRRLSEDCSESAAVAARPGPGHGRVPAPARVPGVRAQLGGVRRPLRLHPQDPAHRRADRHLQGAAAAGECPHGAAGNGLCVAARPAAAPPAPIPGRRARPERPGAARKFGRPRSRTGPFRRRSPPPSVPRPPPSRSECRSWPGSDPAAPRSPPRSLCASPRRSVTKSSGAVPERSWAEWPRSGAALGAALHVGIVGPRPSAPRCSRPRGARPGALRAGNLRASCGAPRSSAGVRPPAPLARPRADAATILERDPRWEEP